MKIWTQEEEAENLKKLFTGVNRSEFAREHGINHNIIYQQMRGIRPIGMKNALMYADFFNIPLENVSPRLALEAENVRQVRGNAATPTDSDTKELLSLFEGLDPRGKKRVLLAVYDAIDAHNTNSNSQTGQDKAKPVNYGQQMPQADLVAVVAKHYTLSVDQINEKHSAATGESLPYRKGSPGATAKRKKTMGQ